MIVYRFFRKIFKPKRLLGLFVPFLLFVYGIPLIFLPNFLSQYLTQIIEKKIEINDIRFRYNIFKAQLELIVTDIIIHDNYNANITQNANLAVTKKNTFIFSEETQIQTILIGINNRWELNGKWVWQNSVSKEARGISNLRSVNVKKRTEDIYGTNTPYVLGVPNYWENNVDFSPTVSSASIPYIKIVTGFAQKPFVLSNIKLQELIKPINLKTDSNIIKAMTKYQLSGSWEFYNYHGIFFSEYKDHPSLVFLSNKFSLIDVVKSLVAENEQSIFNKDFFKQHLSLDPIKEFTIKRKITSDEIFAVNTKINFDNEFGFQNLQTKIISEKHYFAALVYTRDNRYEALINWDLANLQSILPSDFKKDKKVIDIETKGNVLLYYETPHLTNYSIFGITNTMPLGLTISQEVLNLVKKSGFYKNLHFSNSANKPIEVESSFNLDLRLKNTITSKNDIAYSPASLLQFVFNFSPNLQEEKFYFYSFSGNGSVNKPKTIPFNFSFRQTSEQNIFGFRFSQSFLDICTLFDFCKDIPPNLILGHRISTIKGSHNLSFYYNFKKFFDKKIYYSLKSTFFDSVGFEIPFIGYKTTPNTKTNINLNGYMDDESFVIKKAHATNQSGLDVSAANLVFNKYGFSKGIISSDIDNVGKANFKIIPLTNGEVRMEVKGDVVSFAPYLGFYSSGASRKTDMFDRHFTKDSITDINLTADVKRLRLNGSYEWRNVKFEFIMKDGKFYRIVATGDNVKFRYIVNPDDLSALVDIDVEPAGELLYGIGLLEGISGGHAIIKANAKDADSPLIGKIELKNFSAYQLGAVAKFFDLLSISNLFSGLNDAGIQFDSLVADAKMFDRQIILNNGILSGASMEMTFVGLLDLLSSGTNIEGTYVPKNILTRLIDVIPLVNVILPMSGDRAVIGSRYVITGDLDNLKVRFNVGTALTPGFLRDIFGRPKAPENFIDRQQQKQEKLNKNPTTKPSDKNQLEKDAGVIIKDKPQTNSEENINLPELDKSR